MWINTPEGSKKVDMNKGNRYENITMPKAFFEKGK